MTSWFELNWPGAAVVRFPVQLVSSEPSGQSYQWPSHTLDAAIQPPLPEQRNSCHLQGTSGTETSKTDRHLEFNLQKGFFSIRKGKMRKCRKTDMQERRWQQQSENHKTTRENKMRTHAIDFHVHVLLHFKERLSKDKVSEANEHACWEGLLMRPYRCRRLKYHSKCQSNRKFVIQSLARRTAESSWTQPLSLGLCRYRPSGH